MKKALSLALLLAAVLFALWSCGGGGGGGGSDTDPGLATGPTPTDSAHMSAALTALQANLDAIFQSDVEPTLDQIAAAIEAAPGMVLVSKEGSEVVGAIGEGGPVVYVTLPPPSGTYDPATDPALLSKPLPALKVAQAPYVSLPDKTNVLLLNGLGGATYKDVTPDIEKIFTDYYYKPNYTVTRKDASIENLKTVRGVDVLFIKSHGFKRPYMSTDKTQERLSTFALSTSNRVDLMNPSPAVYNTDINKHNIVFVYAATDKTGLVFKDYKYEWLYGITAGFVDLYWQINPGGLAFICACSSASTQADTFRATVYQEGASAYIGWSAPIDSDFADHRSQYVFDRMLGANSFSPASPEQRAFTWVEVQQEMQSKNLVTWLGDGLTFGPSTLKFMPDPADDKFGILAPSIKYLEIEEKTDTTETPVMTIHGTFGEKQGHVYLINNSGESELTVNTWGSETITCLIPPDEAGDVVVEVNGIRGNKRRISKWEGKVYFTVDSPTPPPGTVSCDLKDSVTWDLKFRGDIDSYRSGSGQMLIDRTARMMANQNSSTTYSSSGSWVLDGPFTYHTWTGGGTTKLYDRSGTTTSVCDFSFDTGQKQLKMNIYFQGAVGSKTIGVNLGTAWTSVPSAISTVNSPLYDEKSALSASTPYYALYLTFDADWNIVGGEKQTPDLYAFGGYYFVQKFKWDAMTVQYPPVTDKEHGK